MSATAHPSTKTCRNCREAKAVDAFSPRASSRDGYRGVCKACRNAQTRAWDKANPERRAALSREWARRRPQRSRSERLARQPQKVLAREALHHAIQDGRIIKPTRCEACGKEVDEPALLHGHHQDYAKPLEVDWLCRPCHLRRHGQVAYV